MYFERIKKAFESVLDAEAINTMQESSTMEEIKGWDSMNFIALVMAIESEFKIELSTLEAAALTSVSAIDEYLKEKI